MRAGKYSRISAQKFRRRRCLLNFLPSRPFPSLLQYYAATYIYFEFSWGGWRRLDLLLPLLQPPHAPLAQLPHHNCVVHFFLRLHVFVPTVEHVIRVKLPDFHPRFLHYWLLLCLTGVAEQVLGVELAHPDLGPRPRLLPRLLPRLPCTEQLADIEPGGPGCDWGTLRYPVLLGLCWAAATKLLYYSLQMSRISTTLQA